MNKTEICYPYCPIPVSPEELRAATRGLVCDVQYMKELLNLAAERIEQLTKQSDRHRDDASRLRFPDTSGQ